MKTFYKILAMLFFMLNAFNSHSQVNFKWDIVIDSVDGNKAQIYSKTKLFISETWESAQDVIKNDDYSSGIILLQGTCFQSLYYQTNDHVWTFSYFITFIIKDNQCRIIIDNVRCIAARTGSFTWPLLPVAEQYPPRGYWTTSLNEDRYLTVMAMLRNSLQRVVADYTKTLKAGCVIPSPTIKSTYQEGPYVITSDNSIVTVWSKIIDLFAETGYGIKTMDKASGFIISEECSFRQTYTRENENGQLIKPTAFVVIGSYHTFEDESQVPQVMSAQWNIRIKEEDGKTIIAVNLVNIKCSYSWPPNQYSKGEIIYFPIKSTGVFEKFIADRVK